MRHPRGHVRVTNSSHHDEAGSLHRAERERAGVHDPAPLLAPLREGCPPAPGGHALDARAWKEPRHD